MSVLIVVPPEAARPPAELAVFAASIAGARQPRAAGVRLLGALGILLIEERFVDERRLARSGARVLNNRLVTRICAADLPAEPRLRLPDPDYWFHAKIGVEPFRAAGITGAGVVVGIMDSGVDPRHCELGGVDYHFAHFDKHGAKLSSGPCELGVHGTHSAGLVAGRNAGIAPGATLAIAAVLTERGGTAGHQAQLLAGLNWLLSTPFQGPARPSGCHVINAGLQLTGYNELLRGPLVAAAGDPGSLMIAAMGNQTGRPPPSPANYDIVLGVGASDRNDQIAGFSQHGIVAEDGGLVKPDLCAPGVEIWSCVPGGFYTALSGTSQASAIVCGAAALLIERDPGLARHVGRLREALLDNTVPLPDRGSAAGRGRLRLR